MNAPIGRHEIESLRNALPRGLAHERVAPQMAPQITTPAPPVAQPWREALGLLHKHVPFTRRMVHAGDLVHAGGEVFHSLHIINSGMVRSVNFSADGREQVVGLHFKGDWLGFDGIATGRYGCDAISMDTGEIWTFRYDALLRACAAVPDLMAVMHAAMSGQIKRDRDTLLALGTLPADARVADFLMNWALSLRERDLRTDQITLRMTRAEIGNTLGMTLETVSRALCRMARAGVIRFQEKGRRDISIPSIDGLAEFIQAALGPVPRTLQ